MYMCYFAGALLFMYYNHVEILGHCVMIVFSRGGDNMRVAMVYNGSERRLRSVYAHLLLIWPQDKGEERNTIIIIVLKRHGRPRRIIREQYYIIV